MTDQLNALPIFGRGFTQKSPAVTDELLINCYREPEDADQDKSAMPIYGTPGCQFFANIPVLGGLPAGWGDLLIRGRRKVGNYIYLFIGCSNGAFGHPFSAVVSIDAAGTVRYIATSTVSLTNQGRVGISDNGSQVIIVDGTAGYIFSVDSTGAFTSALTVIAAAGFPNGATTVEFINGYFVVDNPNATPPGRFNWCTQYNGSAWNSLDFATAESNPDPLINIKVNFGQIFLLGSETTEVWTASGDTAIFRRVGAAGIEWGLAAKWSVDKYATNSLIFLGKNKLGKTQLIKLDGYTATPITSPDLTAALNKRNPATATGFSYALDAHSFYQINFTDLSLLYDDASNSITQVQYGLSGRHLAEMMVELNNILYVTDYSTGQLYKFLPDYYLDNGQPIIRTVQSKHLFAAYNFISINELYLDMETGVGLDGGVQGSNPQVMCQWSKDNGRTWGNQIWQSFGAGGAYNTRAVWRNLGRARDIVFRFQISDPVKVVIAGAGARIS